MTPSDDQPVRRLRRFFSPAPIQTLGQIIELSGEESRHLLKVIRLKKGDRCFILDAQGRQAQAEIIDASPLDMAKVKVVSLGQEEGSLTEAISFYVGIPQKAKFESILQKAQELGVSEIVPLITEYTVVRPGEKSEKMMARWNRIVQEAAKQSGAQRITHIQKPATLKSVLAGFQNEELLMFFHPEPEALSVWTWLSGQKPDRMSRHFFIGPEGGFSNAEMILAKKHRAVTLSLGETLLKVDTAFIASASMIQFYLYDSKNRKSN